MDYAKVRARFWADVKKERAHQDERFGTLGHDRKTWLAITVVWVGKFAAAILLGESVGLYRRAVQVAALALAMVEQGAAEPADDPSLDEMDWQELSEVPQADFADDHGFEGCAAR